MAKNGQSLTHKFVHTSLFTQQNYIIPTSYDLANMRWDCYGYTTWVKKVGTYLLDYKKSVKKLDRKTQTDTRVMWIFYRLG